MVRDSEKNCNSSFISNNAEAFHYDGPNKVEKVNFGAEGYELFQDWQARVNKERRNKCN